MTQEEAIGVLRNGWGERLDHSFTPGDPASTGGRGRALVVIGHGVTANKDRPWLVALSEALSAVGVDSLRISFSGNGNSEGRYEEATITKEVADLGAALEAAERAGFGPLTYVGHSMGGAVGVLRASTDERIRHLVSLAGMVYTAEFAERKFGGLVPGRDRMWEKPECPLSQAFLDDLRAIGDVLAEAAQVTVPWLLVHGSADEVVLPGDSVDAQHAGPKAELVELEGADHVFSGAATAAMIEAVVARILAWHR